MAAFPVIGSAATTVCWSGRFAGLHDASDRAEAALGQPTRDVSRVAIYAEKIEGFYFYQANYIPAGELSPAKIASTEPLDMTAVLSNILARRIPGSFVNSATLERARTHLTVYSGAATMPDAAVQIVSASLVR